MKNPKITITKEKSEPRETLVCNLREQVERPWVFKMGRTKAENLVKQVRDQYESRKADWFKTLLYGIVENMSFAPVPGQQATYDLFDMRSDVEMVVEAFKAEMRLDTQKPPAQTAIKEKS